MAAPPLKKTSIYLDEGLDRALAARAAEEGVSKAEFIRRNLEVAARRQQRRRISVGVFDSGLGDLARNHDTYLAEGLDAEDRRARS